MKKSIILGIIILLALIGIIASKNNNKTTTENVENKVATTIFPLYDITRQIAGDEFEVVLIVPSGTSPHTFDPQPSLLKDLQGSQAIFAIGHGLDDWSHIIAESINSPIVIVDQDINLRTINDELRHKDNHNEQDNHKDHKDEHNHGTVDPHYWLSIHNAKQITINIAHELSDLDPKNASIYMLRAQEYTDKLENLKVELKNKTDLLSKKNIITLHGAWYYFAEEFDFNIVGSFKPSAGEEATSKYIINLQNEIDEHNVSTLFTVPQVSKSSFESFANDHGLSISVIDPLGGVEGRNSYVELIRYNVNQVIKSLSL